MGSGAALAVFRTMSLPVVAVASPGRWNRRITDFIALGIVTCALMEFCSEILGIRDSLSILLLALACASQPVLRLVEARRSDDEPQARQGTAVTAMAAAAPWILLGWLHSAYPTWSAWQPAGVPLAVRYAGCLLAFGVILARPLLEREAGDSDHALYVPPATIQSVVLMISLLMVSGSVIAAGLTVYWLAATAAQRLLTSAVVVDKSLPRATDVALERTFVAVDL